MDLIVDCLNIKFQNETTNYYIVEVQEHQTKNIFIVKHGTTFGAHIPLILESEGKD